MPTLIVGKTSIDYEVRRSARSKLIRIEVTPEGVEVIAPSSKTNGQIRRFVQSKRKWVFEKLTFLTTLPRDSDWPPRIISGAKIPFRGRRMRLRLHASARMSVKVVYHNGFEIHHPPRAEKALLLAAIETWLWERVRDDIDKFVRRYSRLLEVDPKSIRLKDMKHFWGSCGPKGVIHLSWRLIFAPKPVLEYAVVHELCHLKYRTHSKEFWLLVKSALPDYKIAEKWLRASQQSPSG